MTLQQVAKRAGVSTATVSRVLNGGSAVKDVTRKRVLQTVEELQYRPNLNARSLASGTSRTLGMIVSNIGNPFFLDIFCSLEQRARDRGYAVIVEHTDYRADKLVDAVRSLLGLRPAGLAIIVSEMDLSLVDEICAHGVPAVFYDVGHPASKITHIQVRYEIGMRRIVEYLYALGHRRMAFVGHHAALEPLKVRRKTFVDTVRRYASGTEYMTMEAADSPAGAWKSTRDLLATGFDPTAIVCANDYMAIGVLRACREGGLCVPRDISVTGFDDIDMSSYTSPPLTTASIPRARIGELCLEALLGPAAGTGGSTVIDPEVVVRESTAPARQSRPGRNRYE